MSAAGAASPARAVAAREQYAFRNARLTREAAERSALLARKSAARSDGSDDAKRAAIQAAIERARLRQTTKQP